MCFMLSAEDTYTGLVDKCAAAGRGGCHLLEDDNETGVDIKARLQSYMDVSCKNLPSIALS